jgi:hypothetical protein
MEECTARSDRQHGEEILMFTDATMIPLRGLLLEVHPLLQKLWVRERHCGQTLKDIVTFLSQPKGTARLQVKREREREEKERRERKNIDGQWKTGTKKREMHEQWGCRESSRESSREVVVVGYIRGSL